MKNVKKKNNLFHLNQNNNNNSSIEIYNRNYNKNKNFPKESLETFFRIFIFIFFYENYYKLGNKILYENYYLINPDWMNKFKENYNYQKLYDSLNLFIQKNPQINYNILNMYI